MQGVQEDLHHPLLELVVLQVGQGGLVVQEVLKVLLVQEELLGHSVQPVVVQKVAEKLYLNLDFPGIHTDCGRNCRVQKTVPWCVNTAHDRGCHNMTDLTFLQFHVLFHCSCVKLVHNVAVVEVGLEQLCHFLGSPKQH